MNIKLLLAILLLTSGCATTSITEIEKHNKAGLATFGDYVITAEKGVDVLKNEDVTDTDKHTIYLAHHKTKEAIEGLKKSLKLYSSKLENSELLELNLKYWTDKANPLIENLKNTIKDTL